ncbi:MAG: rhomboid family intramembrane serine protease [Candidatus Thermoplasmatota archaeon]|nr:rhomboid family intramembrane serine protease [Candidatus Thermoplasmatota archaeon]
MVRCHVCGKDEQMPYRCSYCGNPHCSDHRLPEAHLCPEKNQAAAARLQRTFTGDPGVEVKNKGWGSGQASAEASGWDAPLGRHEGKTALYTLVLIGAVFVAEILVQASLGTQAFERLFVLDANWPNKPWTLITSVFAHGGFNHILFNGIVLFFFGPILERRIGSRRFLALMLASGVLAGLAQVTFYATFLGHEQGVVGISGALMGIMGTLTVLGPRITVLLFFIIPAPLWALTIGYAVLDTMGLFAAGGGIAHLAHLAGLAVGLVVGFRLRDQGFKFPGRSGHLNAGMSQSRW